MARKRTVYTPSPTINNFVDVQTELYRIKEAFDTLSTHIATEVTNSVPDKPNDLDIRYADGVSWNPRGLGAGLYLYAGGVWRKISLS